MESIILPARSRHAIARREPNLLVPGRLPSNQSKLTQLAKHYFSHVVVFRGGVSNLISARPAYYVGSSVGIIANRARLPGDTDQAIVPDSLYGMQPHQGVLTLYCQFTPMVDSTIQQLIAADNNESGIYYRNFQFRINSANNVAEFIIFDSSGTPYIYTGTVACPVSKTSAIVARYDGARIKVWTNGVLDVDQALSISPRVYNATTTIGCRAKYFYSLAGQYISEQFSGFIDLAAISASVVPDDVCKRLSAGVVTDIFESANQSPFLISIPGGGGATIEADLTISAFSGITPEKNTIFESGLTVSNILSTDPILANSILDTAIVLSSTLLSEYSYTVSLEAAISFINSLSTIQNSIAIYETNGVYDIVHGTEYQSQVDFLVQVLFAKTVASLFTTGSIIETGILLGVSQNIINNVTAVIEAATVYSTSQGMDHGNSALLNAIQSLDISQGIDFNSIASLQSSITFGVDGGIGVDGAIGTSQVDASLSMGLIQSYLTSTGSNIWEPSISVGLLQSIDAMTIANLFATTTLGSQLVFTTSGGNSIESAISYAIHHNNVYEVGISIEGSINFGINQFLESFAQADINGTVLLTQQVGLQTVVQAVMNAGLTLSSISNITVNGSVLSLEVTLPCGRTLLVSIENRILQIQADNRTISINGCN